MELEVYYVKRRMIEYLYSIYTNSTNYPPPGKNAANGLFQQSFKNLYFFSNVPAIPLQNEDARHLYECFQNLVDRTNNSFANVDLYSGSKIDLIEINSGIIINAVKVLNDFVQIIGGDEESRKKAEEEIKSDLKKLIGAIKEDKVDSGTHGNGWVSVNIKVFAPAMKSTINDNLLAAVSDPDIKNIKILFNNFCDLLLTLETGNHKPWLTGDWQIQFTGYCLAFAKALEQLKSPQDNFDIELRNQIP